MSSIPTSHFPEQILLCAHTICQHSRILISYTICCRWLTYAQNNGLTQRVYQSRTKLVEWRTVAAIVSTLPVFVYVEPRKPSSETRIHLCRTSYLRVELFIYWPLIIGHNTILSGSSFPLSHAYSCIYLVLVSCIRLFYILCHYITNICNSSVYFQFSLWHNLLNFSI